jgi:ABC-2 type transport system permease protein
MKLPAIFITSLKDAFQYKARGFVWTWSDLIPVAIQLYFWNKAFESQVIIGGQTKIQLMSYYLVLGLVYPLLATHPEFATADDINKGILSQWLLKPTAYWHTRIWVELAYKANRLMFVIPGMTLIWYIATSLIGKPVKLEISLITILIIINSFLISFFLRFLIGLTAIWVTEIGFIIGINEVVALFLSGSLLPLYLFPAWFQTFSNWMPFQYSVFIPTQALLGNYNQTEQWQLFGIQSLWIFALYFLFRLVWTRGMKSYAGFGN